MDGGYYSLQHWPEWEKKVKQPNGPTRGDRNTTEQSMVIAMKAMRRYKRHDKIVGERSKRFKSP